MKRNRTKHLVMVLALTGLYFRGSSQINTPSGATKPFGSNTSYEFGIMPTNLPTTGTYGKASEVATIYNSWKNQYIESCGSDKVRVRFDTPSETVSEGIAYAMLLSAYAADKDLFDKLWAYYKQHRNTRGVMHWKISGCNSVIGENGATDAELDAAMALIVASKQWPASTSPHNYKTDGVALINAIRLHEVNSDGTFENGDAWKPACRNPSYQAPAYARAFKLFMAENGQNQNAFWDNVAAKTENLFANNAHTTSGLSTNWCTPSGPPSSSCSGSGTSPDKFGYDACRAPWRQGVDVLWWGPSATGQVQSVINRQADFWINKGGAGTVQGSNSMNHDGSGSGDHNGAYTGPIGAMSLGAAANTARQNFANALYTENKRSQMGGGYFTSILQMLGLFVQTGNFWNPYASNGGGTVNTSPSVSITSPATNASVCQGSAVTVTASAADADGSVSKVEFYNGNTLLDTKTSAPYSVSWTPAATGTVTLTAKAYDDDNAVTTSAPVSVTVNAAGSATAAPAVTSPVSYCQNASANPLSATGTNLKWYTTQTGGTGSTTAITPNTSAPGTTVYYVSQTNAGGCESSRSAISVTVNSLPAAPAVVSPVTYKLNQAATPLSATGSNLKWYTTSAGGTGSNSAPVPATTQTGTTLFYVSQTNSNGCESNRASVEVRVINAVDVMETTTAPVIDGTMDPVWESATAHQVSKTVQGTVSGSADLSASFRLLWDDTYLYVLGEVTDDEKMSDSEPVYEDDGIEVYFDFGNDKAGTYGNNDVQYTFKWNSTTVNTNPAGRNTSGISFSMTPSNTGYTFETRIPWTSLGGAGMVNQMHGFDLHVNDDDNGAERDSKISWNAATDDAWQNTALFGTINLKENNQVPTGIEEGLVSGKISFYPNPFRSDIQLKGLQGQAQYEIMDLNGKKVQSGTTEGVISSDLEAGIYYLVIMTRTGRQTLKMVKTE